MFRLRMHKLPLNGDRQRYTVTAKNGMGKLITICSLQTNPKSDRLEAIYQLHQRSKELMRDCLYERYGNDWRRFENQKQILKSIHSAIKRMR